MSGVLKSIVDIRKRQEEAAAAAGGFVPELYLLDGERAYVRFLSAGDGSDDRFGYAKLHSVKMISKKGNEYSRDAYCTRQDGEACEMCESGDIPRSRLAIWMYVYYILHKHNNPELGKDAEAESWEATRTRSGEELFKETVGAVQLLKKGFGKGGYLWDYFLTHFDNFGTFNDRVYEIRRRGSKMNDTSYSIQPLPEASTIEKDVVVLADSLPSVEHVFKGNVRYDNEKNTFSVRTATAPEETVEEDVVEAPEDSLVETSGSALSALKTRAKSKTKKSDDLEELI